MLTTGNGLNSCAARPLPSEPCAYSIVASLGIFVVLLLAGMDAVLAQPAEEIGEVSDIWVTVNRIPRIAALVFLLFYGVPVALSRARLRAISERGVSRSDIVIFNLIAIAIIAASVAVEGFVFGEQPPIFGVFCNPYFWAAVAALTIAAVVIYLTSGEGLGVLPTPAPAPASTATIVPASRRGGVFTQATLAISLTSFTDTGSHGPMKPLTVNSITYQEDGTTQFTALDGDQTTIVPDAVGGATINGIIVGRFLPGSSTIRINVTIRCREDDTVTTDVDIPVK